MLRTGQLLAPLQGLCRSFDSGLSPATKGRATADPGVSADRTLTGWLPQALLGCWCGASPPSEHWSHQGMIHC
jgi:hypothetical protein